MNIAGRVGSTFKQLALSTGIGVAALFVALAGIGFLTASFYMFITRLTDNAEAAAITGGSLLILTLLIAIIGSAIVKRTKKKYPSMIAEFSGTFGLGTRLLYMVIRRDPKKAVVLAAITGALAEYILGDTKK